jgi:RNA polymerase sigma factor (sigma-70 family)
MDLEAFSGLSRQHREDVGSLVGGTRLAPVRASTVERDTLSPEDLFEKLRPQLIGTSYQILGSWADAEDAVQATWLKWEPHHEQVDKPHAWLTKVAVRASIDGLRARQSRRENYPGEWLPEPVSLDPGPDDVVAERSSLSLGVLAMMESLSPLERAVFVLRRGSGGPTMRSRRFWTAHGKPYASSTTVRGNTSRPDLNVTSLTQFRCRPRPSVSWRRVSAAASRR